MKVGADDTAPANLPSIAGNHRQGRRISGMYVIAIAWLYVTLLMAATEPNITAGVLSFVAYGLVPLALLLWLLGTPQRRRWQRSRENAPTSVATTETVEGKPDRP